MHQEKLSRAEVITISHTHLKGVRVSYTCWQMFLVFSQQQLVPREPDDESCNYFTVTKIEKKKIYFPIHLRLVTFVWASTYGGVVIDLGSMASPGTPQQAAQSPCKILWLLRILFSWFHKYRYIDCRALGMAL